MGKEKEETSNGTEQEGERGGRPARIGGRGDGGWRRESGREDSKKGSTGRTEDRKKKCTAGEKGNGGGRRKREREREKDRERNTKREKDRIGRNEQQVGERGGTKAKLR